MKEWILARLNELMQLPSETEWVEFKEAKNNFDFDDLGRYFSALSNESNLNGQNAGWLIFGVTNRPPRKIAGSSYRHQKPGLDRLKQEIAKNTNHQTTFSHVYEPVINGRRIVMFQIPPAPRGIPTTWRTVAYGRIHDALGPLTLQKIEAIRRQALEDWSAQVCEGATIETLNPEAIALARQNFAKKNPQLANELALWDDGTFLNKAKVCISGQITRAAIILLGKNESEHFLNPAIAKITWLLRDDHDVEKDYGHFGPPLLLAVDQIFARIRNLTYRHLPNDRLFPVEISQYDLWVIRESLHNCIAHQDYLLSGRVNVVEKPDSVLFTNLGNFLPGSVDAVIRDDSPPEFYRNRFLTGAMVNLNMIDTIGSGIKRMFTKQRDRNFPMPEYDLDQPGKVKVRIFGKVIDERYTQMLMQRTDLSLWEVIALDKVQKRKRVTETEFKLLKKRRLIEGRRPNLFVSAKVAAATETKADYIRKRPFEKEHYKKMVEDYLRQFHVAKRKDFDKLLLRNLSDVLSSDQKKNFVTNLLQEMRRAEIVKIIGSKRGKGARWALYKEDP